MKIVNKIKNLNVSVEAPPSKAHTLRALVISSLAQGKSCLINPLLAEDQLNLIKSLKGLGVKIEQEQNVVSVYGTGGSFLPIDKEINVGESGVSMNFLSSVATLAKKDLVITGTGRLLERPIDEVVNGLNQLGCNIKYLDRTGFPPIRISPGLKGGKAEMRGRRTSQYFSSIAIISPYAESPVSVLCIDDMREKPYFDITMQMMQLYGITASNKDYKEIIIPNNKKYISREVIIEGDYSSSSFFFLAAAICKSEVTVTGLKLNSTQGDKIFVELLKKMGCHISTTENGICVQGNKLTCITENMSNAPDLIPPLAIAAAFANGTSKFTHIGHLRHKECDRLAVIAEGLRKMGTIVCYDEDSLTIQGSRQLNGAVISPYGDHRIAMSFATAGLVTGEQRIEDEKCVAKSFPDFWGKFECFHK